MSLPFAVQILGKAVREDTLEGLCQVAANDLVIFDVDPVKDRLVHVATAEVSGKEVVLLGTGQQPQDASDGTLETIGAHLLLSQDLFAPSTFEGNPCLLTLQVEQGQRIFVVRSHELAALALELTEADASVSSGL